MARIRADLSPLLVGAKRHSGGKWRLGVYFRNAYQELGEEVWSEHEIQEKLRSWRGTGNRIYLHPPESTFSLWKWQREAFCAWQLPFQSQFPHHWKGEQGHLLYWDSSTCWLWEEQTESWQSRPLPSAPIQGLALDSRQRLWAGGFVEAGENLPSEKAFCLFRQSQRESWQSLEWSFSWKARIFWNWEELQDLRRLEVLEDFLLMEVRGCRFRGTFLAFLAMDEFAIDEVWQNLLLLYSPQKQKVIFWQNLDEDRVVKLTGERNILLFTKKGKILTFKKHKLYPRSQLCPPQVEGPSNFFHLIHVDIVDGILLTVWQNSHQTMVATRPMDNGGKWRILGLSTDEFRPLKAYWV
ncbi:MAG: hypothetical protein D6805_07185 [Planctomycetota bacterium]|nr:MAG: hypothetical protein D6805_07185 [Planctomycetota bacterium]